MPSRFDPAAKHPRFQELCDRIYGLEGILACYVVSIKGEILGQNFGQIIAGDELRSTYGALASVLWGGLKNVEVIGGNLLILSVTYEKFKVLGIPIPDSEVGIIATIDVGGDEMDARRRILNLVSQPAGHG